MNPSTLIDPSNKEVSIRRQCALVGAQRSSYYYKPKETPASFDEEKERVMAEIDTIHIEAPHYGARKISKELERRGFKGWSRRKVTTLLNEMNIHSIYPKPNLSKRRKEDAIFPYLLKNKTVRFPNQVWSSDITYVKCSGSHMYIYAIIDWYSRMIVGWDLLSDMGAHGVCTCLQQAFETYGTPGIKNTDQASVFASKEYVGLLKSYSIPQSMDGKARWVDNVFVERWFRSLKTECLRIYEYKTPQELRSLIQSYVDHYNNERIHEALGYETPKEWYYSGIAAAA